VQSVKRDLFLDQLEAVFPGTSPKEIIEQSSYFVFKDGQVLTFNDEVACAIPTDVKVTGAVKASPLLALLRMLEDEHVEVGVEEGEFRVKGKRKDAGVPMDASILLPIDAVERPEKWRKLDQEFTEAVKQVSRCAGSDASKFALTCLHLTAGFVEACDNFQVMRYEVKTGLKTDALVRKDSIVELVRFDMTEVGQTDSWVHFRSPKGLVMSFRVHLDNYPDLSPILDASGGAVAFPRGIGQAAKKAEIFSSQNADANRVLVEVRPDRMRITGRGTLGWYRETSALKYSGPAMKFLIHPELLADLAADHSECQMSDSRLIVEAERFRYVACLERDRPEPVTEKPKGKKEKVK
jgi:hypothetical protein